MTRVIGALKTENRESLDTLPEVQIVPRGVDKLFDSVNYELIHILKFAISRRKRFTYFFLKRYTG